MILIKKFLTVGSGTFVSRILGFVREIFMAAVLGTGPIADAFNAAFLLPNTFRRIFAEGALNTAFVPLFAKETETKNLDKAQKFCDDVLSLLFSTLIGLTILMELLMPWVVHYVLTPGFNAQPGKYEITLKLALIMFPYLVCISLAAMISSMLNTLRYYLAAAIAPIFLNIFLIFILSYAFLHKINHIDVAFLLSIGVLCAGFFHLGIVFFALKQTNITIRLRLPRITKNVKSFIYLAFPAIITGGITQINTLAGTAIASTIEGAISCLSYADRLFQLPLSIIGISVAIVLLPELSRSLKAKENKNAQTLQTESVEFTLFLSIPATTGLFLLAEQIIRVVYERGEFAAHNSTPIVAKILMISSLGLPAFVLIKTFTQSFIAREDTFTPMVFACISATTNIIFAFTLSYYFGILGIITASVLSGWLHTSMLMSMIFKQKYWNLEKELIIKITKIVTACSVMATAILIGKSFFNQKITASHPLYIHIGYLILFVGGGIFIYFSTIYFLGYFKNKNILSFLHKKNSTS